MPKVNSDTFDGRIHACVFVLGSGIFMLLLALVLQAFAWEAQVYISRMDSASPWMTDQFFMLFGLRPQSYLASVMFWFWWPMVGSLVYCLLRYREPREFNIAFIYWISICWLLVAIGVAMVLALFSLLAYILLAHFQQPPSFMRWVPTISGVIPVIVVIFSIIFGWRYRTKQSSDSVG